tara:strand:+ start:317 stop:694 length:378 start_codon:yes stop_codon:yes gene_type:complete
MRPIKNILGILTCSLFYSCHPAIAEPQWVTKPIQCGSELEVDRLLASRNQIPLIGMVGNVTFEQGTFPMPIIMFYGEEENNFHIVEYNFEAEVACIIAIGDNVDFNVGDYFYEKRRPQQYGRPDT